MSSVGEFRGSRIPDFGPVIQRPELVQAISSVSEKVVLLSAPSGYGKSVLAAQVAHSPRFDDAIWVDLAGQEIEAAGVYASLAASVGLAGNAGPASAGASQTSPQETLGQIHDFWASTFAGRRVCVVLDDLRLLSTVRDLHVLANVLSSAANAPATLVVTSRSTPEAEPELVVCAFDVEDLRFGTRDARALAGHYAGPAIESSVLDSFVEACGGQAALLAVMARHAYAIASGEARGIPFDITSYLRRVADEQLSDPLRELLTVASLLGTGTLRELRRLLPHATREALRELSSCMPLLRTSDSDVPGRLAFRVHDFAQEAYIADVSGDTWDRVLGVLDERQEYDRLFWLLARREDERELLEWLERRGRRLLASGRTSVLLGLINSCAASQLVSRPALLLQQAWALRSQSKFEEAQASAALARRWAEHQGEEETLAEALLLAAYTHLDLGQPAESRAAVQALLEVGPEGLAPGDLALGLCMASVAEHCMSEFRTAEVLRAEADGVIAAEGRRIANEVYARIMLVDSVKTSLVGRFDNACYLNLQQVRCMKGVSGHTRAAAAGNRAVFLSVTGRPEASQEALSDTIELCGLYGLEGLLANYMVVDAVNLALYGDVAAWRSAMRQTFEQCAALGDQGSAWHNAVFEATCLNAYGDHNDALTLAEKAAEHFAVNHAPLLERLAIVEMSAALLGLGDVTASQRWAEPISEWAREEDVPCHALRSDYVLAEIARREGRVEDAVTSLAAHRDYVLTESVNWDTVMYTRAFPGLLGVLAAAVGPDDLPVHMIRHIQPEHAAQSLHIAREWMDPAVFDALSRRLATTGAAGSVVQSAETCRVRLFGSLEVVTPAGPVPERAWRKRKARLLFAMLAAKRGQDVPRDQLLDYLWPEMDEDRARNNLYVVWSAMKRALVPGAGKADALPYVENVGGLCRVRPETVRTDLDDFDEILTLARKAESDGDREGALASYDRLAQLYVGDLLPGDVYDDWFAPLREQYRHAFSDAMLRAASLHAGGGDDAAALECVRRALAFDAWREDLYQAALRYQIALGQRSAAIETFVACRGKLADDLGIDPSADTCALYQEVLAMEEPSVAAFLDDGAGIC